jgi:hypothetical protein
MRRLGLRLERPVPARWMLHAVDRRAYSIGRGISTSAAVCEVLMLAAAAVLAWQRGMLNRCASTDPSPPDSKGTGIGAPMSRRRWHMPPGRPAARACRRGRAAAVGAAAAIGRPG